jgi:DNA primase
VEHDPDSFIREFGKDEFEVRVQTAIPLSTYMLQKLSSGLDLTLQEGRGQLLQRAKPLLGAIVAPTNSLLLRKEVAALAGISHEELESLYGIAPIVRSARTNIQKKERIRFSTNRLLLQCLLAQPELGRQMPEDWQERGAEAEAVKALLMVLHETDFTLSGPTLSQLFHGTEHENSLALAEAEMLVWGADFDIVAEFSGLIGKFKEERRREEKAALDSKGLTNLTSQEREQYKRLTSGQVRKN